MTRILIILTLMVLAQLCYGQAGTADSSFNGTGRLQINTSSDDYFCYTAQQSDGKIYVAGTTYNGSNNDITLMRLNLDGRVDSTFGTNGKKTYIFSNSSTDNCRAIIIQPDGKILLAGNTNYTGGTDFFCMRLDTAGTLDTSFNLTGKITIDFYGQSNIDLLYGMCLQPDGKILLCGYSSYGASALRYGSVVRLGSDGKLDANFNGSGKSGWAGQGGNDMEFYGINVQSDGKILVTGKSPNGSTYYIAIYRMTSSGGTDNSFNSSGHRYISLNSIDYGTSITQQPDKKILVSGYAQNYGQFFTIRLDSAGGNDNAWNSSGVVRTSLTSYASILTSHALLPNGKVVEAGHAVDNGGKYQFAISRKKSDGTPDSTFNGNGKSVAYYNSSYNFTSYGLTVLQDGRYLVSGYQNNGSKNKFTLMVFKGDTAAPTFTFAYKTANYGDTGIYMTASSNSSANITYSIVSGNAASIDSVTGAITINSAGTVTVMASQPSTSKYTAGSKTAQLTILKDTLYISVNNASRSYGASNPSFSGNLTGLVNNDTLKVISYKTTTTVYSNVGYYTNDIIVDSIYDPYNKASNYIYKYTSGDMTITQAQLTAQADSQSRVYGNSNPNLTISYSGFKNGEDSSVLNTLPNINGAPSITDSVAIYSLTISGGSDNNYSFNYINGAFTITKSMLTITANNNSRLYGKSNPTLTISYSGFKNGEDSSVLNTLPSVSGAPAATDTVGSYTLTPSGASDNNYTFNYKQGTFNIYKGSITATANKQTRTYGASNPNLTISYSGFQNGEDSSVLDVLPSISGAPSVTSGVGYYIITPSGGSDNNYSINYSSDTFTITKTILAAKADNQNRIYGATNPSLTISYTGFVNGENVSVINTLPQVNGAPTATDTVGNYTLTVSGGSDDNYDFNYTNGTFSIGKATLTAKADYQTRAYGVSNPSLTITYTGFKNGEDTSVINTLPTISGVPTITSNVGNYTLTPANGFDNNYTFNYDTGTFVINKTMLNATANKQARIYGASNPTLTISYSGFVNGENSSVIDVQPSIGNAPTATSNAGYYTITPSGGSDNNYDFNYNSDSFTITKASLLASTNNTSRPYASANPTFTINYAGFVNGDNASVIDVPPTASTPATIASNAGIYNITITGGSDNNYDFSYTSATLTINKIAPTLTITSIDTGTETNIINITASSNSTGLITFTETNGTGSATLTGNNLLLVTAGKVNITANQTADTNYLAATAQQTVTINKKFNSIQNALQGVDFSIYPNPSNGFINVVSDKVIALKVYNMEGQLLINMPQANTHILDLSMHAKGLYLLVVHYENNSLVKRIVVE